MYVPASNVNLNQLQTTFPTAYNMTYFGEEEEQFLQGQCLRTHFFSFDLNKVKEEMFLISIGTISQICDPSDLIVSNPLLTVLGLS